MPSHLVIVESPTKAKTIKKFLGKDYSVQASMGHVRDLPSSTLAVDVDNNFEPTYEVAKEKEKVVKMLNAELKDAKDVWIATDEDREGEAIGWHLTQVLKIKKDQDIKRIVFHEITEDAIKEAVANPRAINQSLVDAQQARRVLDRLVGYTLSPFLWKKVYRGLSAGRVQSVAVRLIVDREREIQAFNPVEYWSIDADLETQKKEKFTAEFKSKDGKKFVPSSKEESDEVLKGIEGADFSVDSVDEKKVKKNPPPPFTTSTLQQEAGRKLGFSVKQTMVVAQQLYEGMDLKKGEGATGLITYMRTDSVNLSDKALKDAKATIENLYGREYILTEPRKFKTKSKGAQEAHEAIRPTEMSRTPDELKGVLDAGQHKLYTLIWNRTMATQMATAELKRVGADIKANNYMFRATGQTVLFDGYMRVYSEGKDESDDTHRKETDSGEKLLPPLAKGDALTLDAIKPEQHFTKPPPRYTEASLVKKMEEEGIGRPSTYAPTISTVQQRGYILKEGKQLKPEDVAFTVTDLLAEHFKDIVDLQFTANMEQSLDDIADGKEEWNAFLGGFYNPFKEQVEKKGEEVKKEDVMKERVLGKDPDTGLDVVVRSGRFGPYVQLGRLEDMPEPEGKSKKKVKPKSASIPKDKNKDEFTFEEAMALLSFPRTIGTKNDDTVEVHLGRFGPYIRWGKITATLEPDDDPSAVDMERAMHLVDTAKERRKKEAEPIKTLGEDPNSKGEITVKTGRYGPYITDGKTNVSVPKSMMPEDVDLILAVQMLDKKRNSPAKGRWAKKK